MSRTRAATALACSAATLVAFAQAPAAPAQTPVATFRADTRLVEVSVVVHDKNGQPVTGLTRDDFTLLDDGSEQPIELFSVESDHAGTAAPALAPEDFSNRLNGRAGGAVTVVLFDRLNTRLQDQRQARDQ